VGHLLPRRKIIFIRSWLREVVAIADVEVDASAHTATLWRIHGDIAHPDNDPAFIARFIDYLIRSHTMALPHPAPLNLGQAAHPKLAAMQCFHAFGNLVSFATEHPLPASSPITPLRTASLLHFAAARGDTRAAEKQLDHGIPIGLLASDGRSPLHWAIDHPGTAIPTFLLDHGGQVDVRSDDGVTPLIYAAARRRLDLVDILLARGADPRASDIRGITALLVAADVEQPEIVKRLLARGASPNAANKDGQTPLSLARERGNNTLIDLLMHAPEDRVPPRFL
jgi:ankyrin repeat protein